MASGCSTALNNYMTFNGQEGLYTFTFEYAKKPDCLVCSDIPQDLSVSKDTTLGKLIEGLGDTRL